MRRLWIGLMVAGFVFFIGGTCAGTPAFGDETPEAAEEVKGPFALDVEGNLVNLQQIPDSSFIYDTPLTNLAHADSFYDNQTVQIQGEAIGEAINIMGDSENKWITLADTSETCDDTVTVYMSASQADLVKVFGSYGQTGSVLQVRGTFHLACSEHNGTGDIHAEYVTLISEGAVTQEAFNFDDFMPGVALLILGGALTLVFYFVREKLR